jgi:SAM-dependent methyltransferase
LTDEVPATPPVEYGFEDWLRGYVRTTAVELKANHRGAAKGKHFSASVAYHRKLAIEILSPAPGERILDLGCANGATTVYCTMFGARCIGVDLSAKAVKQGNEYLRRTNRNRGTLLLANAGVLPFPDASFDKVVTCDLVEHIDAATKLQVFKEARRVLRPGGCLVVKTPNLAYLKLSLAFKRLRALTRFENPFTIVIPHTPEADGADAEHIGLTTVFATERHLHDAGFFDYQFHYGLSTKFPRLPPWLNRLAHREVPVLRDVLVEELIVKATKSGLADLIPDR